MSTLSLFIFLGIISTALSQGSSGNGTQGCAHNKADIVFLLDSSASEGSTNFHKQLQFVERFVNAYDIGPDKVQVSVVTFASSPHNAFYLNTYHDKTSLLHAISRVSYISGGTTTYTALKYVRQNSFLLQHGGRYGVPQMLVVMTDGQSSSPTSTKTEAAILHTTGIKVIAIGIGSGVNQVELKAIATDDAHAFTVASFNALSNIQSEIQNATCVSEIIENCDSKQVDIVFVLDASGSEGRTNFHQQIDFVRNVTNKFTIGPSNIQVSVVTFSTSVYNEFFLNAYHNKLDVSRALNNVSYSGGTTHTEKALQFVRLNSFKPENGGRGVTKLVVVLTDGQSTSHYDTVLQATQLHHTGVKVIAIGIGSGVSHSTELADIASDSQHVFTVSSFQALSSIQTEIQRATCSTPSVCGDKPTDIVFVLDSSSSEGSANFHKQLDFMAQFVKQFDIGPSGVQVGLVTFSTYAHNKFYLNAYKDKYALISAIQNVQYQTGSTATDKGLSYVRRYQFTSAYGVRPNSNRIVIVLTDGHSNDVTKTVSEAHLLKGLGVKVVAIGIGTNVNTYELFSMAYDTNHAFTVSSFSTLNTLQAEIKNETCGVKPTPTLAPGCGNAPADIVFVLDSSSSEGSTNFQKQVDFVRDFAYQFQIGPQAVQISVVLFSTTVREQFALNKYHDRTSLLAAIAKITYHSGITYTDKALAFVRQSSFLHAKGARNNATHLVVVITDGQSTSPSKTVTEAALLKSLPNTKVIAIGIGTGVRQTELNTIASDTAHALTVANFDALQTVKSELTFVACQTCGFISKADILFILDASSSEGAQNFQKQLDFVSRVVNDFQIGPNNVQIGILTFSDYVQREFYLNTYQSKSQILSAIQNVGYIKGLTNTDKALEYARNNMFTTTHGERADAKNYVIVLTDGSSANLNRTVQQAALLKQQNIAILAIGIGSSINRPELNGMASDSKHVFEVSSFDALKTIRTDIKAAACEEVTTPKPTLPSTTTSTSTTTRPTTTTSTTPSTTTTTTPTTTTTTTPTTTSTTMTTTTPSTTTTTTPSTTSTTTATPTTSTMTTTTAEASLWVSHSTTPGFEQRRTTSAPQTTTEFFEERRTTPVPPTTTEFFEVRRTTPAPQTTTEFFEERRTRPSTPTTTQVFEERRTTPSP